MELKSIKQWPLEHCRVPRNSPLIIPGICFYSLIMARMSVIILAVTVSVWLLLTGLCSSSLGLFPHKMIRRGHRTYQHLIPL